MNPEAVKCFFRIRKRTQSSAFFVLFQTVDVTSTYHSILTQSVFNTQYSVLFFTQRSDDTFFTFLKIALLRQEININYCIFKTQ